MTSQPRDPNWGGQPSCRLPASGGLQPRERLPLLSSLSFPGSLKGRWAAEVLMDCGSQIRATSLAPVCGALLFGVRRDSGTWEIFFLPMCNKVLQGPFEWEVSPVRRS